jgi:hypothetical protein
MTRPKHTRPLNADEIEIVRMVAHGRTDAEIAAALNVKIGSVRCRVNTIYHALGIAVGAGMPAGTAGMTRLRLVIWAYENGVVGSTARTQAARREQALANRAFSVCRQLVHKRPYPVVREQAVAIIRERDAELAGEDPTWQAVA